MKKQLCLVVLLLSMSCVLAAPADPGDVDGNGVVDVFDIIAALADKAGTYNTRSDSNNDGQINVFDLVLIARYYGTTYTVVVNNGNEPAGFVKITEHQFSTQTTSEWNFVNRQGTWQQGSDAAAPGSPAGVGTATYAAGFPAGSEPFTIFSRSNVVPFQSDEVYISFWFKVSSTWQGHSSGVNKILHLWNPDGSIPGENIIVWSAQGSGNGDLLAQLQLTNAVARSLTPNMGTLVEQTISRGQWHHWEARIKGSTGTNADGEAHWWLDGKKVGQYTNIQYFDAAHVHQWDFLEWAPTWGGVGGTISQQQEMSVDNIYVSKPGAQSPAAYNTPNWPLRVTTWNINKAYPGVEYNHRLTIQGGEYPYTFQLLQGPSGMTIDSDRGILRWTPSSSSSGNTVQVRITDSAGTSITHQYTLDATTSGFYFVSPSGTDAPASGSISQPYQTLAYARTQVPATGYVYVRSGTYAMPSGLSMQSGQAKVWMEYPGDTAIIDFTGTQWGIGINVPASAKSAIVGFEMIGSSGWLINADGTTNNVIVRGNEFHATTGVAGNNPGGIFTWDGPQKPINGVPHYQNWSIQENYFHDIATNLIEGNGVVFYDVSELVMEDNIIHDVGGRCIHDKDDGFRNTFRNNHCYDTSQGVALANQYTQGSINVHHNLFENVYQGVTIGAQPGYIKDIYVHHNTFRNSKPAYRWVMNETLSTNFNVYRNIIVNPAGVVHLAEDDRKTHDAIMNKANIDENLLYTTQPNVYSASWNAILYTQAQWQAAGKDVNSIWTNPGLQADGSLSAGSQYFGSYGRDDAPDILPFTISAPAPVLLTQAQFLQNEPPGYQAISERPFAAASEAGWWVAPISGSFGVTSDAQARYSPSSVGRMVYPVSMPGGWAPASTGIGSWSSDKVYVSFLTKLSPNFVGHSSGVNKVFFVTDDTAGGGGDPLYTSFQGAGSGPYEYQVRMQGPNTGARNLGNNLQSVPINRDQWYHIEVLLQFNTGTSANGKVDVWIDGVHTTQYTDVMFSTVGDHELDVFKWEPTWGGTGGSVAQEQYMYVDHAYVSAASTAGVCEATGSSKCYYIDPVNGDDAAGDGSFASPWETFAKVVYYFNTGSRPAGWVQMNPGDYVYLMDGVHDTLINPGDGGFPGIATFRSYTSPGGWYTIKAYPGTTPILDPAGSGNGLRIYQSDNFRIEGITVRNAWQNGIRLEESDNFIVDAVEIYDTNGIYNDNIAGLYITQVYTVNVTDSVFHDNYDRANPGNQNNMNAVVFRGSNVLFANNAFYNSQTGRGGCLKNKHSSNVASTYFRVYDNTFDKCAVMAIGIGGHNTHVQDNIITNSAPVLIADHGGDTNIVNITLDHNTFYNSWFDVSHSIFDSSYAPVFPVEPADVFFRSNIVYDTQNYGGTLERGMVVLGTYFTDAEYNAFGPAVGLGNNINNNCYYNPTVAPQFGFGAAGCGYGCTGGMYSFSQWQAQGFDVSSVNANPLFIDAASGNFALQPGSLCTGSGAR